MHLWLPQAGRTGARLLMEALRGGGVESIQLPPGQLPLAGLVLNEQVVLIGGERCELVGPITVGTHGKIRMTGLTVRGDIRVEGFGVLNLNDVRVTGCTMLAGGGNALFQRCILEADPARGSVALLASGQTEALVSLSRVIGGDVVAMVGPAAKVRYDRSILDGLSVQTDRDPLPSQHGPAQNGFAASLKTLVGWGGRTS